MEYLSTSPEKRNYMNATTIGKHLNISSQKLNVLLSKFGWIEKDGTGWLITKLGETLGGTQCEHEVTKKHYVVWPNEILSNSKLLEVSYQRKRIIPTAKQNLNTKTSVKTSKRKDISFREKYKPDLKTYDGHFVRSKSEVLIDNLLYIYRLVHAYERKLPFEEDFYCDFYIPPGMDRPEAVYIEFWGLQSEDYLIKRKKKLEFYRREKLNLIELDEDDIKILDEVLPKKLLQFNIKVYYPEY